MPIEESSEQGMKEGAFEVLKKRQFYEPPPKTRGGIRSAKLGCVDGGPFAILDGAVFMWVREIHLGAGWHSLDGVRHAPSFPIVSKVW